MVILKQEILDDEGVYIKQEEDPLDNYQDNLVIDADDYDDIEPPGEEKENTDIDKMIISESDRYCPIVPSLCLCLHTFGFSLSLKNCNRFQITDTEFGIMVIPYRYTIYLSLFS